ncbi:MAG: hypothetical protein JSU68_15310 [Phycisphaerales bacterium]|nr:MAG: hypothetical protein JSU68_15310 [Phycisphaerales bacterium]
MLMPWRCGLAFLLGWWASVWLIGCGASLSPESSDRLPEPRDDAGSLAGGRFELDDPGDQTSATRYYLGYDVLRVEVPRGTVSQSETLWNHVDESVVAFAVTRRLRVNGFRIGLADPEAWPAIKAALDSAGATQTARAGLAQDDLLPFAIEVDPVSKDRTIFHYGRLGALKGSTYADSLTMLRIEHTLNPERLVEFNVRLVPEARSAHFQTALAATETGLREIPIYQGKVFTELAVQMVTPKNGIIVVGPSGRAGRQSLIGTEFFCAKRNGIEFERVFFITPRLLVRKAGTAGSLAREG